MSDRSMGRWERAVKEEHGEQAALSLAHNTLNPATGHAVVVVGPEVNEKVFEVVVATDPRSTERNVTFVTDSVEVLRGICNRGFPLQAYAARLLLEEYKEKTEIIFDITILDRFGSLSMIEGVIRAIRRAEPNTFELRFIKN